MIVTIKDINYKNNNYNNNSYNNNNSDCMIIIIIQQFPF